MNEEIKRDMIKGVKLIHDACLSHRMTENRSCEQCVLYDRCGEECVFTDTEPTRSWWFDYLLAQIIEK